MTQVSKIPISPNLQKRINTLFLEALVKNSSRKDLSLFLEEFLTSTERIMLAKRVAIAYLVAQKYDYRTISLILKVSTNTVTTTAARYLHNKEYKKLIDKLLKDRETSLYWDNLAKKFTSLFAKSVKSGGWKAVDKELEQEIYEPF